MSSEGEHMFCTISRQLFFLVGGTYSGRCTKIDRTGIYAWRSIWRWELDFLPQNLLRLPAKLLGAAEIPDDGS